MKVKISTLGIIGAIFGFVSLAVPWFSASITFLFIHYDLNIGLEPYKLYFPPFVNHTFFEGLVLGQILMIVGSLLALIFLNKIEDDRNQKIYDKIPLLGLIGGVLNGLAILNFFMVLIDEGSGFDITPDAVAVEFGLISSIISVVLIILAFLAARGNSKHLKITLITVESKGSREKPNKMEYKKELS